jgi:hypothetical protein
VVLVKAVDMDVKSLVWEARYVDESRRIHGVVVPNKNTPIAVARVEAAENIQHPTGADGVLHLSEFRRQLGAPHQALKPRL